MSVGNSTTSIAQRLGGLRSWRWRGSLQDLPHLAIEIQLKVYSYLDPRDLLVLVRTCKQFRTFFLHRSNEPLWRAARENVGNLPPCPPFMSEPAFLNLLFSTYCQNCGKPHMWKAMWVWFARYCPNCVIALSYSYDEAEDKILDVDQHEAFSTAGALLELFGVYQNQRYVNACEDWHEKRQKERAGRFEAKRREHFTEIIKRLKESEWDQEAKMLQRDSWKMEGLQVVRQPSKFSPKSWEKAFKAMYPILRSCRHQRLVKESAAVFRPRFAALQAAILAHYIQLPRAAQMDHHPDSVDLALMDECRAIADVPADQTVTQEDFARIVPELAVRWEQERKKELTEAVIACLPVPPPDDVDVLGLGIAIFPCMRCPFARQSKSRPHAFYRYPAILSHPCAHAPRVHARWYHEFERTHNKNMEVYTTLATIPPTPPRGAEWHDGRRWHPFAFPFSPYKLGSTIDALSQIMRAMGLDPSRTTEEELQASPVRLSMSKIYSWEAALHHPVCHTALWDLELRHPTDIWELADPSAACEPEGALLLTTPGAVWACSLCVQRDARGDRIKVHLMEK
ncbi:hypothetical protein C8Q74DRAFT_1373784 [Fomes fomentarius]|nr:hypothetical protein C8Q74DRAFT_1373784 [Fomes fomentarius]